MPTMNTHGHHHPSETLAWYLRSLGDWDTHRGTLTPDGTVAALCGARFQPRPLALGGVALRGEPPDPEQACRECQRGKRGGVAR